MPSEPYITGPRGRLEIEDKGPVLKNRDRCFESVPKGASHPHDSSPISPTSPLPDIRSGRDISRTRFPHDPHHNHRIVAEPSPNPDTLRAHYRSPPPVPSPLRPAPRHGISVSPPPLPPVPSRGREATNSRSHDRRLASPVAPLPPSGSPLQHSVSASRRRATGPLSPGRK
ncbi:unnamed protein product [Protopolystoma xenopodis]|uniref:Uncharacterized protein n=1 Tax=Protopolystoma xenopodis TaxID=117903 RepID=A0A3S5B308_9PLAT|nr:unnamed protein product [Protopolystoma xenopodis]